MLYQTFLFLGQLWQLFEWQLFEVSQILEFLRYVINLSLTDILNYHFKMPLVTTYITVVISEQFC